jgi:hypothetical protein
MQLKSLPILAMAASSLKAQTASQTFVDQISGYSTSDIAKISEIAKSKGGRQRAGDIYRGELAQEIAGEIPTRAASMAKGIPFVRGYVEPTFAGARASYSRYVANDCHGYDPRGNRAP